MHWIAAKLLSQQGKRQSECLPLVLICKLGIMPVLYRLLDANGDKAGGNFMQKSDPDVLDQTQSFCAAVVFLLHVGINVPTQCSWMSSERPEGQRRQGGMYLCHLEAVYLFLSLFPEPLNSLNCLPTRFTVFSSRGTMAVQNWGFQFFFILTFQKASSLPSSLSYKILSSILATSKTISHFKRFALVPIRQIKCIYL